MTELVDCAPEEIGIAPDLLGHAELQSTKKHCIQAVGMKAHARSERSSLPGVVRRQRGGNQVTDRRIGQGGKLQLAKEGMQE